MLLLLVLTASAHPAISWNEQLGRTWVLTEGWTSMDMVLSEPVAGRPDDDWIGIVFRPNGTIGWEALRPIDWTQGCSNSFGGFGGTWDHRNGRIEIRLIEYTRGHYEYPTNHVVVRIDGDVLVLRPEG